MVRAGQNRREPLAPPTQDPDESYWYVEPDVRLYHFAEGTGRPVLIVHGGPGYPYAEPWPGLASLTGAYIFHYYDQRGCGRSTRPVDTFASRSTYKNMRALDRALGIGEQLADIERIRQILGEERLILVGHSFGGFLASLYAAEFPDRVEALVLVAPADVLVMPTAGGGLFEDVRERLPDEMQDEYAAYLDEYLDFRGLFAKSEDELAATNAAFARYYQAVIDTPIPEQGKPGGWVVQALYLSMGRRHDYRDALEAVGAPVLVIHGANDLQTVQESRSYVEAFPNAQLHVIENAGHFAFYEGPEAFGAAVEKFLRTPGSTTGLVRGQSARP
jgi:proline iminopeptidase